MTRLRYHLRSRNCHFSTFAVAAAIAIVASTGVAGELIFAAGESNDIYQAVKASTSLAVQRVDSAMDAVAAAKAGDGVLVLADQYPEGRTEVDASFFAAAKEKGLRVYVEYPSYLPNVAVEESTGCDACRGVIVTDWFGDRLQPQSIVTLNGMRLVGVSAENPMIVAGRVAGFDVATFKAPAGAAPVLFQLDGSEVLAATTKLSGCITARNAPTAAWQAVWSRIIAWLAHDEEITITWTPRVRPRVDRDADLPADAEAIALAEGMAWFENSKLILTPATEKEALAVIETAGSNSTIFPMTPPVATTPDGDGALGCLEGVMSVIDSRGEQMLSAERRADCICETAMALALGGDCEGKPQWNEAATKLLHYYLFDSTARKNERGDPKNGAYGLVAWGLANGLSYRPNYSDDNARVILSAMVAANVNGDASYDEAVATCLLANLRTTGQLGFRGARIDVDQLSSNGWKHYYNQSPVHLSPHHEAYLWACYLWAYKHSGEELFRKRAVDALERMMADYPNDWRWTNGMAQERARIILPLAWLVRVDDSPRHREWLQRAVDGLLNLQVECGAIREELGPEGFGVYPPPTSNEAYGLNEAPLIADNDDPVADLLYTNNFALVGLHEAAAVTGDPNIATAEQKLVEFLCRVQIDAPQFSYLHGGWYRAFDFDRWEYFGSNADSGWGAWSIESGWTQAWITAVLAMRKTNTNLWDLTQREPVGDELRRLAPVMLTDEPQVP